MATTRQTLKDYFKKYATPTEAQFAALIDSFVHKDEDSLTQEKIDGLTAALNDKVSSSELQTAVEAAVAETLQGGNLEVTPAAHEHAVSDISGLGARLTTLETSKADYEAFKTLVTAFLNDADVSDTTINRWKELKDFLAGITDSDTLAGMLQALKAEILAEVPQPQTGNYLEQVTDMAAALQTAEVGKIVQYVGQSDAEYTRGLCYEKKEGDPIVIPAGKYVMHPIIWANDPYPNMADHELEAQIAGKTLVLSDETIIYWYSEDWGAVMSENPTVGDLVKRFGNKMMSAMIVSSFQRQGSTATITFGPQDGSWTRSETFSRFEKRLWHPVDDAELQLIYEGVDTTAGSIAGYPLYNLSDITSAAHLDGTLSLLQTPETLGTPSTWQPIITSPAVS